MVELCCALPYRGDADRADFGGTVRIETTKYLACPGWMLFSFAFCASLSSSRR